MQVVPHLGECAKALVVCQRTPSSVDVRDNRTTDTAFVKDCMSTAGWQRRRMENFVTVAQTAEIGVEDMIKVRL